MNRSADPMRALLPLDSALQHERAPRPLPLFLELVREASEKSPQLARDALVGLRNYANATRAAAPEPRQEFARVRGASLRDYGGSGAPAILIPSLINPPDILDLDPEVSLATAVAGMGRRALLLDWGPARDRAELSIAGHVEELLMPLLHSLGEAPALVGYCLGGTMAIAAANLTKVERVATLACPWHFARYPEESRGALRDMWMRSQATAQEIGALPMEVLQAAFWSLDPARTVRKFANFAQLSPESAQARRFIALEDWANQGEPLPFPAAKELIEILFMADHPGSGRWTVNGEVVTDQLKMPCLHILASQDRIAPADTAPSGDSVRIAAGHVGMVVGSSRQALHEQLAAFLGPACR